jgi:diaminopimelate decarboxylase
MGDHADIIRAAERILAHETPRMDGTMLSSFVARFVAEREVYLNLARRHGSPLYIIDENVLRDRARRFMESFQNRLQDVEFFYAMKSNNHPAVSEFLIGQGLGLDVSSGEELKQAIALDAREIVFSGPGKTPAELTLAAQHAGRVTVLIDSFGELDRLERAAAKAGAGIQAGVRLTTDERGLWRKFGIPLSDLAEFIESARSCRHVSFRGLQFHSSWNLQPDNQEAFIARLGGYIANLTDDARAAIRFIDIGGGYWPPQGEWLHAAGTPEGRLRQDIEPNGKNPNDHFCLPATPIEEFARRLSGALRTHIFPHVQCAVYLEPGRWICNDAMHILLTVIDKKGDDLVITDGGGNAVGWERFETDYFPVINLTRPGQTERPCLVLGSLCTPHDVWGYGYFGETIEPGDMLLIPTQGAYTYSLRQNFIKPLPAVAVLSIADDGNSHDAGQNVSGGRKIDQET